MNDHDTTQQQPPEMISLMGYSLAKETGQIAEGIALCEKAIARNPYHTDNYLNLGRIYLLAGERRLAIRAFRTGLKIHRDARIINELANLGIRKSPFFRSLPRDHRLNIMAGRLLRLFRLR